MVQGSKRLPHVMKLAKCRIELVRVRAICGFVASITRAKAAEVHDAQDADDAEANEGRNEHFHSFAS